MDMDAHKLVVRSLVPWYRRPAYRLTVWRLVLRNRVLQALERI